MATESDILYPEYVVRESMHYELPYNHEHLLGLMVEHANSSPYREVGGRIITNEAGYTSTIVKLRGKRGSIYIPRLEHDELAVFRQWTSYIVYHSHPLGYPANFSEDDFISFRGDVKYLRKHLQDSERPNGVYRLYDYVVNAMGDFDMQAVAFDLTRFYQPSQESIIYTSRIPVLR